MKNRSYFLIIIIIAIGTLLFYSCSLKSETDSANTTTVGSEATTPDTDSNLSTGVRINSRTISATLKKRLQRDNLLEMSADDWGANKWKNERIGRFYKYDDEVVQMVVAEQTNEILALTNRKMTRVAERRLRSSVNNKTRCSEAVSEMLEASFDTEPLRDIQ